MRIEELSGVYAFRTAQHNPTQPIQVTYIGYFLNNPNNFNPKFVPARRSYVACTCRTEEEAADYVQQQPYGSVFTLN